MSWSGADFKKEDISIRGERSKDASISPTKVSRFETKDIKRWLKKSKEIQWDYKKLVKRKGLLKRLK